MSLNGSLGNLGLTLVANTGGFVPGIRSAGDALNRLSGAAAGAGDAVNKLGKDGRWGRFLTMGTSSGKAFSSGFSGALGGLFGGGGGGGGGLGLGGLGAILPGLGGLLSGGGIVAGLHGAASAGGLFTQSLALLGKKANATGADLAAFRAKSIELGLSGTFNPTEAIAGMTSLSSAGLGVQEVLATIGPTLAFTQAAAGKLSTEQSANLVAQSMALFKVGSSGVGPMLDKMAKSADMFAMNLEDLPLGLANASRGTNAIGASMNDTLVTFGLMRKLMPRVESAGTAVGVAMESMAKKDVQEKLKGIGVAVEGAGGKFRPFLDIVGDMLPEMQKMTQVQRAAFLQTTFGADAVQGLQGVFAQLEDGIPGANGQLLKGAEAVAFLRGQMDKSKGSLDGLAEAAGTGFTGAMARLTSKFDTFKQVVGASVGGVVAPAIDGLGASLSGLVSDFEKLPASAKSAMAQTIVAVAGLSAVFLIAGGPVALLVAAVVAGGFAIKAAIDGNIGGLGDKFHNAVAKVRLVWGGFVQLFSQGGFSGAVRKELNAAENGGIKNFVIGAWVWLNRLKNFFAGVGAGFTAGLSAAKPAFDAFGSALDRLLEAFGMTSANDPAANVARWEKFGQVGARVGRAIADGFETVVSALTHAMEFVRGFSSTFEGLGPTFDGVRAAGAQLAGALNNILAGLGLGQLSAASMSWSKFGAIVGGVVTGQLQNARDAISGISRLVNGLSAVLRGVSEIMTGALTGDWSRVWTGMKHVALGAVKSIVAVMGALVLDMAKSIDRMGAMVGKDFGASKGVRSMIDGMTEGLDSIGKDQAREDAAARPLTFIDPKMAEYLAAARPTVTASPGGAYAAQQAAMRAAFMAPSPALAGMPGGFGAAAMGLAAGTAQRTAPITVKAGPVAVYLDSQQIAARVTQVQGENAQRGGGDVPVPSE